MAPNKAAPKCPKCDRREFAMTEVIPISGMFPVAIVHCAGCGAAIGAVEAVNVNAQLQELARQLGKTLQ